MKKLLLTFAAIQFLLLSCLAQTSSQVSPDPDKINPNVRGEISGQVTSNDGQKFTRLQVVIWKIGGNERRIVSTDEKGTFTFRDLPIGVYQASASAAGYVSTFQAQTDNYRLGDHIGITMEKGGAITGKIFASSGRPMTGAKMSLFRVRDEAGNLVNETINNREIFSDDRGVYRLYGLRGDSYVVSASLMASFLGTPKNIETPIYHPSSTRNTAKEIVVRAGAEISAIDINYRSETGRVVSGTIANSGNLPPEVSAGVQLVSSSTGAVIGSTYTGIYTNPGFAFYGVPDGEYEITASQFSSGSIAKTASPIKVVVHGADVTDLVINFSLFATVSGRVTVNKLIGNPAACQSSRRSFVEEIIITSRVDNSNPRLQIGRRLVPDVYGDFSLTGISEGTIRFGARLPSDFWYLKAVVLPTKTIKIDVALQGLSLKNGERISGLSMQVAEGAVALKGNIFTELGLTLPPKLRVHLVPAEAQEANNLLRYFQTETTNSLFDFHNLPPGKYLLYVEKFSNNESMEIRRNPIAWDEKSRAQLRIDAEAVKQLIELAPCQKVKDFAVMTKVR